jgi:RNase P subunit RPR2
MSGFDPATPYVWHHKPGVFRKRRKHAGDEAVEALIAPEELEAAKRAGRKWCSECRKFREWKDISFRYEIINNRLRAVLYMCDKCGTIIGEKDITDG